MEYAAELISSGQFRVREVPRRRCGRRHSSDTVLSLRILPPVRGVERTSVWDVSADRVANAEKLGIGARLVVAREVQSLTADVVVEAAGSPAALESALSLARAKGRIASRASVRTPPTDGVTRRRRAAATPLPIAAARCPPETSVPCVTWYLLGGTGRRGLTPRASPPPSNRHCNRHRVFRQDLTH
jgi:hypothetical protein